MYHREHLCIDYSHLSSSSLFRFIEQIGEYNQCEIHSNVLEELMLILLYMYIVYQVALDIYFNQKIPSIAQS